MAKEKTEHPTTIHEAVAEGLAKIAPVVRDRVVDTMVQRQVVKAGDAIVACMDKLNQLERDARKLVPDIVTYDEKGEPQSNGYSKARIEERKKVSDQIAKLTKAIEAAVQDKPDYGPVFQAAGGS